MHSNKYLQALFRHLIVIPLSITVGQALAAPTFRISLLESLTPQGNSSASAINNLGQVAGSSWGDGIVGTQATLWTQGQALLLPERPGELTQANGINDLGVVVGERWGSGPQFAMQWGNGNETILPSDLAQAFEVNNHGVVVGWNDYGGNYFATVWKNGEAQILKGVSSRYAAFEANGINNLNQIVGGGAVSSNSGHALLWQNDGYATDLGVALNFRNSFADAINDQGVIVGASYNNNPFMGHATLWRDGVVIDLGSPVSGLGSIARDINLQGQIVGVSHTTGVYPTDQNKALFWDSELSQAFFLDDLIDDADPLKFSTSLITALGINDAGVIVGTAMSNGKTFGYLLTPVTSVPEASSFLLYSLGLSGLFVFTKFFRRRQSAGHGAIA